MCRSWADGIKLLHCEGYCLYRPSLTKELTLAAKRQGALVSIDLASFEVRWDLCFMLYVAAALLEVETP
jgi:hypothetical protein